MANRTQQLEHLHALQASTWVETMRDPTPRDKAAFVAWLKESPRNVRDFLLMISVDHALDDLDSKHLHDIQELLISVDRRITPMFRDPMPAKTEPPRRRWRWAAAAACLLAALVGAWWIAGPGASGGRTFTTATGEQRAFELEDGSVINLNTHSRVAIHFRREAREVRLLEGEALFNVRHESARPFRVYTHDAVVQAVGTQFNVYQRAHDTLVSVIAGRVSVAAGPQALAGSSPAASVHSVGANEQAQINSAGSVSVRSLPDVTETVAWRDRRLVFREQTLQHIAEEFNRYSRRQIRLQGADVEHRVYTGVFDVDDTESLEQVLARDADLVVDQSESGIVVKHR